jgi:hypothetical protein
MWITSRRPNQLRRDLRGARLARGQRRPLAADWLKAKAFKIVEPLL